MKKINYTSIGVILICLLPMSLMAQNWRVGGNTAAQMGPPGTQPVLGTLLGNNSPLMIETNGTQRMFIRDDQTIYKGYTGIGDGFSDARSLLHVYGIDNIDALGNVGLGNLFQTTGSDQVLNRWVMSASPSFAERFFIENPPSIANWPNSKFNMDMGTSRDGEINFYTHRDDTQNPGVQRQRSVSIQGGQGLVAHGQVAFGNQLPDGFDARSRIHLHKRDVSGSGVGSNFIQFTNTNTIGGDTPGNSSGFQIGTPTFSKDILLRQWEDAHMRFYTNGVQRVHINELAGNQPTDGFVGINNTGPTARLDINGDLRIRNVQEVPADALLLGLQHGPNADDHDVRRLDFNGQSNTYLGGNGQWVQLPTAVVNAENGLSVDGNGSVVLGQNNGDPNDPAQLLNNREVPLNNHQIYFTDENANGTNGNRIGIGVPSNNSLQARLHVRVNEDPAVVESWRTGIRIDNNALSGPYSVGLDINMDAVNPKNEGVNVSVNDGEANDGIISFVRRGNTSRAVVAQSYNVTSTSYGIYSDVLCENTQTVQSNKGFGVKARSRSCYDNYGGHFTGGGGIIDGVHSARNFGIYALGQGYGTRNYGVYASASGADPGGVNYGVWAEAFSSGSSNTAWAGWFRGNVNIQGGGLYINQIFTVSDQMFKTNIDNLTGAMSLIQQLQPRTFEYDTTSYPQFGFDTEEQMGLVAQEVENVIPTIVKTTTHPSEYDSLGVLITPSFSYKNVEYEELIPLLIAGMQEQQAMIDSLSNELASVQGCLAAEGLCQMGARNAQPNSEEEQQVLLSQIDVILSNRNNIVLNQNVPNPFAEKTIITYSIPKSIAQAQIHFYNAEGALINTVDIQERGAGQLNVFADDLTSGIYMYTLVADGKIIDTKRMMKE